MKIEHWSVMTHSTCTIPKTEIQLTTKTEIQITTTDDIDTKKFMDYVRAYNDGSDPEEYEQFKSAAKEQEKLRDSFRGYSPEMIYDTCTELYGKLKAPDQGKLWDRKRFTVGLDILRQYSIFWTPPHLEPEQSAQQKPEDIPPEGKWCGSVFHSQPDE